MADHAAAAAVCAEEADRLPVGTRIRFKYTLDESGGEKIKYRIYAHKGELGVIVKGACAYEYWVKADSGRKPFGAHRAEFEVLATATATADQKGQQS